MSLESKIEALTLAVTALTAAMQSQPVSSHEVPRTFTPAVVIQPDPTIVAPVQAAAPTATAMPPLPTFIPPTPPVVAVAPTVPFSDMKGLITYTMDAYKSLGPQKGALIQNVLKDCSVNNINDTPVEKFAQFYAGVEALKAS